MSEVTSRGPMRQMVPYFEGEGEATVDYCRDANVKNVVCHHGCSERCQGMCSPALPVNMRLTAVLRATFRKNFALF